jgi:hypothetical protein
VSVRRYTCALSKSRLAQLDFQKWRFRIQLLITSLSSLGSVIFAEQSRCSSLANFSPDLGMTGKMAPSSLRNFCKAKDKRRAAPGPQMSMFVTSLRRWKPIKDKRQKSERIEVINTEHLLKVTVLWISIMDIVCFGGVALVFMRYALHMNVSMGENVATIATFISGLVIWNVIAFLGAWLFTFLHNKIKP